jgi:hypothetical protein
MQEVRLASRSSLLVLIPTCLFACGLAYEPLYHILRGSLAYTIIPQDDFWYYYLTAKHFALQGFSSFDGIISTNGYHPLWMLCLSVLTIITNGNDTATFILMEVVQVLSALITAQLLFKLFRTLYGETKWVIVASLLAALLLTVLIFLSMETVVAIPLYIGYFYVLQRSLPLDSNRNIFLAGLIGSLLVLARLDTLILVILGLAIILIQDRRRTGFYLVGLLPILIYFVSNKILFDNWLPVSAQVKMLSDGFHFNFRAIEAAATPRGSLYILLTIIGGVLAFRQLDRARPQGAVRILLFIFPILFALTLAFRLTWSSYMWYFFPYPIAATAGLLEIREVLFEKWKGWLDRLAIPVAMVVVVFAGIILYRDIVGLTSHINLVEAETRAQPNIYLHALGIKPFTDAHPGRYAMGDRAGLTAFITGKPILQVEGLAADQTLVDSIAYHADLFNVLQKCGVHYYIVSYPLREFKEREGHWDLYEPHKQQVQPWAPTMHGRFYAPEVFRFPAPVGAVLTHNDSASLWVTRILDISQAHVELPEGK